MLPPLKDIKAGLRLTTEALAAELAQPGGATPGWDDLQWRLAAAAAVAHGAAPLLDACCTWQHPVWQRFLRDQRAHVGHRYRRIATLLERIDANAQRLGLPVVPLKGAALHAMGLYAPGDRPMADIDLLVREEDTGTATELLQGLGYEESYVQWKHRVFEPVTGQPVHGLGEHRDAPVTIELHSRIQERLPVSTVDITAGIYPRQPRPGLNDYPSTGALMSHLLLHAAGCICNRNARLMHLNDIALLSTRMTGEDWNGLWQVCDARPPWWALPPLRLVNRYYRHAIPAAVPARVEQACPVVLKTISRHQTLTRVSCSELWLHAFAGMEWSRSAGDVGRYLKNRIRPSQEARKERADMIRTQLWLEDRDWVTAKQGRRILAWMTRPIPRMDTLYVVRAALESTAWAT